MQANNLFSEAVRKGVYNNNEVGKAKRKEIWTKKHKDMNLSLCRSYHSNSQYSFIPTIKNKRLKKPLHPFEEPESEEDSIVSIAREEVIEREEYHMESQSTP